MTNLTKKDMENDKELLGSIISSLDLDKKEIELQKLEKESLNPDFWTNNQNAQSVMKKIESIKNEID